MGNAKYFLPAGAILFHETFLVLSHGLVKRSLRAVLNRCAAPCTDGDFGQFRRLDDRIRTTASHVPLEFTNTRLVCKSFFDNYLMRNLQGQAASCLEQQTS